MIWGGVTATAGECENESRGDACHICSLKLSDYSCSHLEMLMLTAKQRLIDRLHILTASICIVSSVLSRPSSWSLAVDKSTHSLFSLLSSMRMFSNVIPMTSNVVRAEETRVAAAFVLHASQ